MEGLTPAIIKRYKILCLLCLQLGVLDEKMQGLGEKLDENDPFGIIALNYYEDQVIKILEI